MADEKKGHDVPIENPKTQTEPPAEKPRDVTENPGEGQYMFSDWAML